MLSTGMSKIRSSSSSTAAPTGSGGQCARGGKASPDQSCWHDKQGLYIDLCCGAMAGLLRHTHTRSVHIALDKWSNDRSVRKRIDEALIEAVGVNHQGHFPPSVRISHLDATRSDGIQVADFIAGAVFQSVERSDDIYLQMLSERVVEGRVV